MSGIGKPASDLRMRGQGIGSVHQFVCSRCAHPRPSLGRKWLRWRGMQTYVCGACARVLAADKQAVENG